MWIWPIYQSNRILPSQCLLSIKYHRFVVFPLLPHFPSHLISLSSLIFPSLIYSNNCGGDVGGVGDGGGVFPQQSICLFIWCIGLGIKWTAAHLCQCDNHLLRGHVHSVKDYTSQITRDTFCVLITSPIARQYTWLHWSIIDLLSFYI